MKAIGGMEWLAHMGKGFGKLASNRHLFICE